MADITINGITVDPLAPPLHALAAAAPPPIGAAATALVAAAAALPAADTN
jgi:hypothetical protein